MTGDVLDVGHVRLPAALVLVLRPPISLIRKMLMLGREGEPVLLYG